MNNNLAIKVENLCKSYRLYNSPVDRMKESLHPLRRKYHHDFHALRDVSFEIEKGESVGIIGRNGSGKSTLLKILSGVLTPTSGSVTVNGKVSALLELGAGFNPDLTGVENVYFNGMLMGYTREEMDERLDDILAFADIGEFVSQPVKIYSSGMFVRLAYAVAVSVEPDILIVDEALSVGDACFQQRCVNVMKIFKENGGSIIFVSHDMNTIKVLCGSALLLDRGVLRGYSASESIVNKYNLLIAQNDGSDEFHGAKQISQGNLKVKFIEADMLNTMGVPADLFISGEKVTVRITVEAYTSLDDVVVGILIRDRLGQDIFGTNSHHMHKPLVVCEGGKYVFEYGLILALGPGKYTLTLAAHSGPVHLENNYHWLDKVKSFEMVFGDSVFSGVVQLETTLNISTI